jgi:hypothetical protein
MGKLECPTVKMALSGHSASCGNGFVLMRWHKRRRDGVAHL